MNTYSAKVDSFELVKSLFDTLDEHHRKQLLKKLNIEINRAVSILHI